MNILAIDTSCDETSAAVTNGRRILSNEMYSQILIHRKWGGVVPNLAQRAHEERIDMVCEQALKKAGMTINKIDAVAVTYGPGLAIALGVGIKKAQELAMHYKKKLIPVNHMEGHVYSCFAQNSKGKPEFDIIFPYIALLVSGGHTELLLFTHHAEYKILGETQDDAAGEAIDKATRILLKENVYPGGPVLEKLAKKGKPDFVAFPRPMARSKGLDFSYSGIKTAFLYYVQEHPDIIENNLFNLAASFQEAIIDSLTMKLERAIDQYEIKRICVAGGVVANERLRKKTRSIVKEKGGRCYFPQFKKLYGDNAAMIGIAAYFKAEKGQYIRNIEELDRKARAKIDKNPFRCCG